MLHKKFALLFLIIAGIIIFGYIISNFLFSEKFELIRIINEKSRYYEELDTKILDKNNLSVEQIYYYILLRKDSISFKEMETLLSMADKAFLEECSDTKCSAIHTLAPYCILKKYSYEKLGKSPNYFYKTFPSSFTKSLDYWFNHFKKEDIGENNIDDLYGFIVAESNCGKKDRLKEINITKKIIEFDHNILDPVLRTRISCTKFKIERKLANLGLVEDLSKIRDKICLFANPTELVGRLTICDTYNYYLVLWLCTKRSKLSSEDFELLREVFKKRYTNIKDLSCQKLLFKILLDHYLK